MRMYADLAKWFVLLSHPDEYAEEAEALRPLLEGAQSVLELGSGGGHLAHHLRDLELVLTDISQEMLVASERLNPGVPHSQGDMRTLRLGRTFDAVIAHDAIGYMLTEADLEAAFTTARAHLEPGGIFVVMPDEVAETFEATTQCGGHDGPDGSGLRYLEWVQPGLNKDGRYDVEYTIVVRHPDGVIESCQDRHHHAAFPRATWLRLLKKAGFDAKNVSDPFREDVFVCRAV